MSNPPSDLLYFYAYYGSADLTFGAPATMVRGKAAAMAAQLRANDIDFQFAINDAAKSIADAFRRGLHESREGGHQAAELIYLCCLLSTEADENPDHKGFILEISEQMFPSWSANVEVILTSGEPGKAPRIYGHVKAVAGKSEVDAVMEPRRARVAAARKR